MVQARRKGLHGWRRVLVCVVVIVVAVGGGIVVHNKLDEHQMYEIVHGVDGKRALDETMRTLDSKAFTKNGVIHSYTIDDSSIRHNPMGGIMVTSYVNNDRDLYVFSTLNRVYEGDTLMPLRDEGGGNSAKLESLLKGEQYANGVDRPKTNDSH